MYQKTYQNTSRRFKRGEDGEEMIVEGEDETPVEGGEVAEGQVVKPENGDGGDNKNEEVKDTEMAEQPKPEPSTPVKHQEDV
jgi:hypothetical protein